MSLSNRNTNTKTDYASIEGGYDGSPRPPRRTDSVMDKLHQLPQRYFSPAASRQQVCAYILSACLFLSTTCIVLFEPWLRPPCDEALVDAIFPKHDAPFVNPHYDPGCRNVRYIQLLNLTQRECDLGRRILFSILCGGAVGYERRRGDRPAGIRTMALVALGACVLEKHFTLDKTADGPDHALSATPDEWRELVDGARAVSAALGDGVKRPAAAEKTTRINNRKSMVLLREIKAGEAITADAVDIKRPGYGIEPRHWEAVVGKTARHDLLADEVLTWDMLA